MQYVALASLIGGWALRLWTVFDDEARDRIEQFVETGWGGFDQFHAALGACDPVEGEALWIEMSQRIGARDVRHAQRWFETVLLFFEDCERRRQARSNPLTRSVIGLPIWTWALAGLAAWLIWRSRS